MVQTITNDCYVTVAELQQDLFEATGDAAIAKIHAQQFAIMYRDNVIDAVRFKQGLIGQDDLHLSRRIRWQHHKEHSKHLCENMQKAKRGARPANACAHHIVAWGDMRAARSRLRLAAFGIDIDHEANGVYLPRWQSHTPMSTMKNAEAHTTIHTNTYYLNVEYLLEETIAEGLGRNGILQILRDIGDDLKSGEFPLKQRLDQRL